MDGSILFAFIAVAVVFYLSGLIYAIRRYSRKEIPVWALFVGILLFVFPVAIPLVCFYGEREVARKEGKEASLHALEGGAVPVGFWYCFPCFAAA